MTIKIVEYVEIDIDYCSLTHGTSPCTATGTGDARCFNSLATCQDRPNFNNVPVTLRFARDTGYNPKAIDAIPNVIGISTSPSVISLGENLGGRASITITFKDSPHTDTGAGFDKYVTDRTYNPYTQGTLWGKFRQRQPFLRGRSLRLIRGEHTRTLAAMTTRHYVIDSFSGPDYAGQYTIIAKDVLKLADNDRAYAPAPSNGSLSADITNSATALTLSPAGIGNAEYPASGFVAIGGKEVVSFTRVNNTLTVVRGQRNTEAVPHKAGDRIQLVLVYDGVDPATILRDLLVNYAGVPSSYINTAGWLAETGAHLQRVYTTYIAEPTGVNQLASELIEQAALAVWWDEVAQQIKLQVLRAIALNANVFDERIIIGGSFASQDQPDKRVSQVWTYFAQRNPLRPLSDLDNYKSIQVNVNEQNEVDHGSAAVKVIKSRWVPDFGGTIAARLNAIVLARFSVPPRKFTFEILCTTETKPELGGGYRVNAWPLQTILGAPDSVPVQVSSLSVGPASVTAVAEESRFDGVPLDDPDARTINIDTNSNDLNLRTIHDSLFPVITDATGITLTVDIGAGVIVGSTSTTTPAFDVGDWIDLPAITIVNRGRIQGRGGAGGSRFTSAPGPEANGEAGGSAFYTRAAVTINNLSQMWGGGGGGAAENGAISGSGQADAGGGGAGTVPGAGGTSFAGSSSVDGSPGTPTAGGAGGPGAGAGGGPGLAGASATPRPSGTPGAAGKAIDGVSFITFTTAGDRRGPETG